MKLTTNLKKLTKSQLVLFLKECEDKIKDEKLLDEVVNALLNAKSKKKTEIYELADKVQTSLISQSIIENSKKESKKENKEESKKENKEESKKESNKKKLTKKKDEQKEEPKKAKKKLKKKEEFKFPKTLEINNITYKLNNRIKSIKSLQKAIDEGKKIIFANVWLPEHLEQFEYDIYGIVDKKIEKFPNDLDLVTPVLISRNGKIIYAVSIYTDVMCVILAEHLKERNSFGVEFRIYVAD